MPWTKKQHALFAAIANDETNGLAQKYGIGRSDARNMMAEGIKDEPKKKPAKRKAEY